MTETPYITSKQALAILKIKAESLYAYVSRGRIRKYGSNAQGESLFLKADIEQFARSRKKAGRLATKGQLSFREAVIDSSLSQWTRQRASYRGYPVQQFIDGDVPFENCAELLWQGKLAKKLVQWAQTTDDTYKVQPPKGEQSLAVWLAAVHHRNALVTEFNRFDRDEPKEGGNTGAKDQPAADEVHYPQLARHTIWAMADTIGDSGKKKSKSASVVALVCERLGLNPAAKHLELLRRVLIVAMDYQLSAPALIGRVAEGTSSDAATALLLSSIATANSEDVQNIFAADRRYIGPWLQQIKAQTAEGGEALSLSPYTPLGTDFPEGDPRVATLFRWLDEHYRQRRSIAAIMSHLEAYEQQTGKGADLGTALALAAKALKISATKIAGLFLMSRTAGLCGHMLEQAELPDIAVPKARYRSAARR